MVIAELDRKETGGGGLCAGGGEWKTISERNSFSRCLTLLSGSQLPTDSTRKDPGGEGSVQSEPWYKLRRRVESGSEATVGAETTSCQVRVLGFVGILS